VAWAWVKDHWKWLLPPVALLAWYLARSKNVTVASGALIEHGAVQAEEDEKAAAKSASIRASEDAALKQIAHDQAADVAKLNDSLKEEADEALESPEATNDFLKGVSSRMRK